MSRFLVYGTSTAQGYGGGEQGGWVEFVKARQLHNSRHEVFNLAVRGLTLSQIIEDLPRDAQKYRRNGYPGRLFGIFQLGWQMHHPVDDWRQPYGSDEFDSELRELSEVCGDVLNGPPILVNLQPVLGLNGQPVQPGRYDEDRRYDARECLLRYSAVQKAPYVDVYSAFKSLCGQRDLYSNDRNHPNEAGHRQIAELVLLQMNMVCEQYKMPRARVDGSG